MIEFLHWLAKTGFEVFMQLAQLLLDYLKVLAWPIAVLILALVYKRPIIGVLARLRKATGPGVALELDARELVQDARQIATVDASTIHIASASPSADVPDTAEAPADPVDDAASSPAPPDRAPLVDDYDYLRSRRAADSLRYDTGRDAILPRNPNAAIIVAAWADVVDDAGQVAKVLHVPDGGWSVPVITNMLTERGYINSSFEAIVRRLQNLRNDAAASPEPPTEEVVVDFLATCMLVREQLQKAFRRAAFDQQILDASQLLDPPESNA